MTPATKPNKPIGYKCPQCDYISRYESNVTKHMQTNCTQPNKPDTQGHVHEYQQSISAVNPDAYYCVCGQRKPVDVQEDELDKILNAIFSYGWPGTGRQIVDGSGSQEQLTMADAKRLIKAELTKQTDIAYKDGHETGYARGYHDGDLNSFEEARKQAEQEVLDKLERVIKPYKPFATMRVVENFITALRKNTRKK